MATTRVIGLQQMTYDGIERYKGEIYVLVGARNDDNLVKHKFVRPITAEMAEDLNIVTDDSGREFESEGARRNYRVAAPQGEVIIRRSAGMPVGRGPKVAAKSPGRPPGRPKGSGVKVTPAS